MAQPLTTLDGWVSKDEWPHVACPTCGDGHLAPEVLEVVKDGPSVRMMEASHDWDPGEITGRFYGLLRCAVPNCAEGVVIGGDYCVEPKFTPYGKQEGWMDLLRIRFASPPLPILTPPRATPKAVKEAVIRASEVLWIDPGAAANRLRLATEALLTAIKIPRFIVDKNGKRQRLTTHARIREFETFEPDVAEALEAVKWIGNEGSHTRDLTVKNVLEGAEVFGFALRLRYDDSVATMERRIREINKRKGVPKAAPRKQP